MNTSRHLLIWVLVVGLLFNTHTCNALELVFTPVVPSEIMHNQLSPIASELNKHYPGSFMSVPDSIEGFFKYYDKIDLTYCDESQASRLVHKHGFIPLLTTNEVLKATFISQTNYPFESIKSTTDLTFAVNQNDLVVTGSALNIMGSASKLRIFSSNTNMLITLLKNKNMVGVAPEEDVELLPNKLKSKLYIIRQEPLSPIYLLLNPKHKKEAKKIQKILNDFHRLWDRSQTKYTYLNYYSLRPSTVEEIKNLGSKALFDYYENVVQRIKNAETLH